MRKINLNAIEASILHAAVNTGDPQRGVTLAEVRELSPLLDMLEVGSTGEGIDRIFRPVELALKESQYTTIKNKLGASVGWRSVEHGRLVMKLEDRLKELPIIDEPADKKVGG